MAQTRQQWEATAARIFHSFSGQVIKLTYRPRKTGGYDPSTDSYPDQAEDIPDLDAVLTASQIVPGDGPMKQTTAIMKANDFRAAGLNDLDSQAKFLQGTKTWNISSIMALPESDLPVIYKIELVQRGI